MVSEAMFKDEWYLDDRLIEYAGEYGLIHDDGEGDYMDGRDYVTIEDFQNSSNDLANDAEIIEFFDLYF